MDVRLPMAFLFVCSFTFNSNFWDVIWWVLVAIDSIAVHRCRWNRWQYVCTSVCIVCIWCRLHQAYVSMQSLRVCVHVYPTNRQFLSCVIVWWLLHIHCTGIVPHTRCNFSNRPTICWARHSLQRGTRTCTSSPRHRPYFYPMEIRHRCNHVEIHCNRRQQFFYLRLRCMHQPVYLDLCFV